MTNKLTKNGPAWHNEARQMLLENFQRVHSLFTDATKRAVWMGLFLNHIKQRGKEDESIPHGQFVKWLKANVPDLDQTTISTYMRLANGICEKGKFQIRDFPSFAKTGALPPGITDMIEGKTQQQLFLEFKQADDEDPENPKSKRGHNKGSKGLTKEMREKAALKKEQDRINELELEVIDETKWLDEITDAKNLGMMPDKVLRKFAEAAQAAATFAANTVEARKSGGGK